MTQVAALKAFWSQFNENVLRHHIQEEGATWLCYLTCRLDEVPAFACVLAAFCG